MKVRCAFTNCKNNKKSGDGYWCKLKEIHLFSYFCSDERAKGEQMRCEQRTKESVCICKFTPYSRLHNFRCRKHSKFYKDRR